MLNIMKTLISLICFSFVFGANHVANAQDKTSAKESPFNDEAIAQYLSNTDTIPGFESKANKLKISGIVYDSDGVTPASNIIISIEQADERGDFDVREVNGERYLHNRGFIKTDADGAYTFYTYIPGNDRRFNMLQQLFVKVKEPNDPPYEIASILFDEDPLLTKLCRKRIAKKGDISRILKPILADGVYVVQKDIVLPSVVDALN